MDSQETSTNFASARTTAAPVRFEFLTGFESTFIPDEDMDVLEMTGHARQFAADLWLVADAGLRTLRYPAPWHRIEARRGVYDWDWMDRALETLRELGLDPIIDPVHHTSFPRWLEHGFADPDFAARYTAFVYQFARRYPWVKRYTPFNEPFSTTFFCSHQGIWKPRYARPEAFVRMAVGVARVICTVTEMLVETVPGVEIIHVDTCESHSALDPESIEFVAHLNERRFLMHDLVLGKIDGRHPLFGYLTRHGLEDSDAAWLRDHPAHIDVLGLDYYAHSEHQFHKQGSVVPSRAPLGFAQVALQYAARYPQLPLMLSETNIRGYVTDRLSWLKYMVEQSEIVAQSGVAWRGFCWFPFIDSTDWDSLLCRANRNLDPVGIYWLDERRSRRHASELSQHFGMLARGEIGSEGLPAYRFQEPVLTQLAGFVAPLAHWDWQDP